MVSQSVNMLKRTGNRRQALEARRDLLVLVSAVCLGLVNVEIAIATPNKTAQCDRLVNTANKMVPIAEQFLQESQNFEKAANAAGEKGDLSAFQKAANKSAGVFNRLVTQLERVTSEIQGLSLADKTLLSFKNEYINVATSINSAFKDTIAALTTISNAQHSPAGLEVIQKASESLDQVANRMDSVAKSEDKLVDSVNNYCGAK
ncbi:hypothetical protein OsccyDRAFT_4396 [Leptolyngbyaceae cyanobacterium JSC-12]|nr:hypothetical protein OsccyDRAFT_4396 [Leptolyngbyaceae cyanobacterium JSC-12]